MKYLEKNNIFCNISYPYPIHLMKGYKYFRIQKRRFTNNRESGKSNFFITDVSFTKKKEVLKVINIINKYEI